MLDDELIHVLAGWAAVFIGGSLAVFSAVFGAVLMGLFWSLLVAGGILVLIYSFIRWRVPEIINFIKNRELEKWIRSQGL